MHLAWLLIGWLVLSTQTGLFIGALAHPPYHALGPVDPSIALHVPSRPAPGDRPGGLWGLQRFDSGSDWRTGQAGARGVGAADRIPPGRALA